MPHPRNPQIVIAGRERPFQNTIFCRVLLFFSLLSLGACVSTKRYASFTEKKVLDVKPPPPWIPEYLEISMDSLKSQDSVVVVRKLKSLFIPAIVYWRIEHMLTCSLDPRLAAHFFRHNFIQLADSFDLANKLSGKKLELSILQLPHSFVYLHEETTVFLLLACWVNGQETISPDNRELKVRYQLSENNEVLSSGIITIPNKRPQLKNKLKSTKKFTGLYLDQYKKDCAQTSRKMFEELMHVF